MYYQQVLVDIMEEFSCKPPNKLSQLFGGKRSPFFPVFPFLQKYQFLFGLSLLDFDSRNHECCVLLAKYLTPSLSNALKF